MSTSNILTSKDNNTFSVTTNTTPNDTVVLKCSSTDVQNINGENKNNNINKKQVDGNDDVECNINGTKNKKMTSRGEKLLKSLFDSDFKWSGGDTFSKRVRKKPAPLYDVAKIANDDEQVLERKRKRKKELKLLEKKSKTLNKTKKTKSTKIGKRRRKREDSESSSSDSESSSVLDSSAELKNEELVEDEEAAEEITRQYSTWLKYTPYLYDYVVTHLLKWPSLTCSWVPGDYGNELLLGTNSDEENRLSLFKIRLPHEFSHQEEEEEEEEEELVAEEDHDLDQPTESDDLGSNTKTKQKNKYTANLKSSWSKIINCSVHRARVMPQNKHTFAVFGSTSDIQIFRKPTKFLPYQETILGNGHTTFGFGLSWNDRKPGHLLSASEDGTICHWDLNAKRYLKAKFSDLEGTIVNDVQWIPKTGSDFISVDESGLIAIWDSRKTGKIVEKINLSEKLNIKALTSLSISSLEPNYFVTGADSGMIHLWDRRNLANPLTNMKFHDGNVLQLEWSPTIRNCFASSGEDSKVCIWNKNFIGRDQSTMEKEDGPPELLFLHGGHVDKVFDIAWNYQTEDDWCIASTAENNILQVWSPSKALRVT